MNGIPETKSRKRLIRLTAVELEMPMRLCNIAISFSIRPLIDIRIRLLIWFFVEYSRHYKHHCIRHLKSAQIQTLF